MFYSFLDARLYEDWGNMFYSFLEAYFHKKWESKIALLEKSKQNGTQETGTEKFILEKKKDRANKKAVSKYFTHCQVKERIINSDLSFWIRSETNEFRLYQDQLGLNVRNMYIKKKFYWSIVDLKYCVRFCCAAKWISYMYINIHSFKNYFPTKVITEYWDEVPVLYSRSLLIICIILYMRTLCAQSCPTLYDPMDCSPPDPSIHEIFPARILQWVAMPRSRGSSQPRDRTHVSCMAGRFFTDEPPGEAHFIYSSVYISIPISQFIPFPLFSLLEP